MKKVDFLIVSFSTLPLPRPRSYQIAKLLMNLKGRYFLITADHSKSKDLDFSMESCFPSQGYNILKIKHRSDSMPVRILFRIIPALQQLPDNHWPWGRSVIQEATKLKRALQPKVIIAFSRPETDLLVGVKLKRIFGVPLVVHFSDPWVDNPYFKYTRFTKWANSVFEARVLRKADLVVFTNQDQQQLVMQKYPAHIMKKARIIPHCFDETLYHFEPKSTDRFVIRHIGNLYKHRSPESFLRALNLLIKSYPNLEGEILVEFYGQISEGAQKALETHSVKHIVRLKPSVPYLESLRLMSSANLLLNIDAESEHNTFFPSKLVDYIGAKGNILAITSPDGPSARIINSYGGGVFDHKQIEPIKEYLYQATRCCRNFTPNIKEMEKYDAVRVAASFEKMVAPFMH